MEDRIRKAVSKALEKEGFSSPIRLKTGDKEIPFIVGRPPDLSHGDYFTNAALVAASTLAVYKGDKRNPRELADSLATHLMDSLGEHVVSHVSVAGPGFVNVRLAREAVAFAVAEADAKGSEWGKAKTAEGGSPDASRSEAFRGKRIMVEYSNPNAFKEMHIGHLVGTVVGESVSRLIENAGATVMRDTFGGDIGPNVAKALWGLRKKGIAEPTTATEIGAAYVTGSNAYEADPKAKEEIDALNQAIYKGDDAALMDLWRKGREISMQEFRRIWKLLGTHFDFEFFDSDTTETGVRVVMDGLLKGTFQKSDGAVIYDGEKKGVHTMVFITSHNTPTYEAKDIGLAFLKEERWPSDKVIIVTGNEQTGRFKTVLSALDEIAPLLGAKMMHIATGFLKLTSGKMASREGNVITASEFIAGIAKKASEKNDDPVIAEQVAVGAIKYMILRQSPGSDIMFDVEKSLSLDGDSGPYLQYALVRAVKILSYESQGAGGTDEPTTPYDIERVILHYPEVAARAARECAPNLLLTYLIELAAAWNSFYAVEQVLGSKEEVYKQRVTRAFANTMTNGLTLLGIPTPERM